MSLAASFPYLVVYDGDCGLCARSVQFVVRHDAAERYRFSPVQSPLGSAVCLEAGIDPADPSSMVAFVDGQRFARSRAVLRVAISFGGAWGLLRVLLVVPPPLLDAIYGWVARRRRSVLPAAKECLADPRLRARIVQEP